MTRADDKEFFETPPAITVRCPQATDAKSIWHLVANSGMLDVNSLYCYLLVCSDFASTSRIITLGEKCLGFVAAYQPPATPDTLFVWQVGVDSSQRGKGLGKRLLQSLGPNAETPWHYLEATVTPDNSASRRLFASVAREWGADISYREGFPGELFVEPDHEPEERLRIGPVAW